MFNRREAPDARVCTMDGGLGARCPRTGRARSDLRPPRHPTCRSSVRNRASRRLRGLKVHIIGIPSAGKTTLGRGLSGVLSVPHHDLDSLAFVDGRWTPRPAPERDAMVARILEEPGFVTEGGFLGWTDPLLDAADLVFWLDPPLPVLISRHVRRHWRHPRRLPSL